MKRRSLFKRFVSGFMAFALAATVCFDGNLLTPLRANADGEIQTVNVNFYDNDVKSLCVNEEGDNTNYRYFVLGALVDKDADTDIAATKDYVDQFVAWDCKEIFPKTQTDSIATFDTFYEWGSDYQSTADRSKNTVTYNSEKHRFIARVYRYWVTGDVDYNPLNTTASVEPTNLVAPVGEKETKINVTEYYEGNTVKFNEQSSDTFPGYVPSKTDDVDCINVRFDKQNVEFALNINFSDKTTIKADEYIYALVEVEHQNSPTTYYLKQLVCNNAESLTFTVQDSTNRNWTDENQNALPNEQYHGNEKSTTLRVFKAAKECNIGNLIKGENCTELFSGNFLKAQKLDISEIEKSGDNIVTKYSVTVNFLAPASSDNYNFRDILGSGIAFGITADRFALRNHAQTNFATNYYRDLLRTTTSSQGQNIDPDLASETAGEIYVGNFALLAKDPYYLTNEPDPDPDPQAPKPSVDPDPTNITADPNGRLVVGNPQVPLVIRTPDINKVVTQTPELVTLTNKEADGETEVTASSVKNKVVDPIITQMQQMSGRLASKSATVTPVVGESHITVDTLDYPDNATVYVDGDALAVNGVFQPQNMTFKFIKKENQTIVINFKTTKYVTIDEFYLEVTKKGTGEVIEGNSMPDGGRLSEKNQWLDQQVMRRIVWNLRGAVNTEEEFAADTPCVTIRNTAGLFLIPNAQTVTHVPSTSTGWLVSAGYVENNGGEWHFPFSELEGYEAPKETEVTISKKKLIGEDELPGATIRLVDKNTGENIGTTMWENIYDTAKAENPSLAGEFYKMRTNDSVCYGLQWVSGNAPMTLRLRDGAYVLKEWGTKFTYNNEEYTTVTSEFEFEITNGVVTKVSDKIVENSNSSIEYSATNNTFIIRDALTNGPKPVKVNFNKTDIRGEKELNGAVITVYSVNAEGNRTAVSGTTENPNPWTSAIGKTLTLELPDGNYVFTESGTNVTDNDGNVYDVISSEFSFTVSGGIVTSVSENIVTDIENMNENGGALYSTNNSGEAVFTICDAMRKITSGDVKIDKTDITGQAEIAGAKLSLFTDADCTVRAKDAEGKTINEWESDGNGAKTFTLNNGTYYLKETGNDIIIGNKIYKVITSVLKFDVVNGEVSVAAQAGYKTAPDSTDKNGYFLYDSDSNTIKVCDAERTTNVKIDKTDITGQAEIAGAKLSLFTDADCTVRAKDAFGTTVNEWESDGNGAKEFILNDGTYYLKETGNDIIIGNKIYKVITSVLKFDVVNGEVSVAAQTGYKTAPDSTDKNGYFLYDSDSNTIKVCDAERTTNVKIDKTDITGQTEIAGAKLSLFTDADCTVRAKDAFGTTINEWESDGNGAKEFILNDGTYYLKETGDDIIIGNKIYKVITSVLKFDVVNGEVSVAAQTGYKTAPDSTDKNGYFLYDSDSNTIKVCDAERTTNVKIDKTDITGQTEIAGAKLSLFTDADCTVRAKDAFGTTINEWESDGNGAKEFILNDGTYYLKETGGEITVGDTVYKVVTSVARFSIENGALVVPAQSAVETAPQNTNTDGYFLYNRTTETIKVCDAAVGEAVVAVIRKGTEDDRLDGAEFEILDSDSNPTGIILNPSKTQDASTTLKEGTYYIEEKSAPAGYEKNKEKIKFTVNPDGTITADIPESYDSGYEFDKETFTFVVKSTYTTRTVTFSKQAASNSEEIDGAKLRISEITADGEKTVEEWVSGTDGNDDNGKLKAHTIEDKFVMNTVYKLVETTAPNGYLMAETIFFKLDANGKVSVSDSANGTFTELDDTTVVMKDELTSVTVSKKDSSGKALTGAKFRIYEEGSSTPVELDLTDVSSDEIRGLKVGVIYTIKEYVTPDKYIPCEDTYFYINKDGSVLYGKTDYTGEMRTATNNTVVIINDMYTEISIGKRDIAGQAPIEGATLGIYTDENCTKLAKDAFGTEIPVWTSKKAKDMEVQLADGTYYLRETSDTSDNVGGYFVSGDVKYRVITSVLEFSVHNGKILETVGTKAELDEDASEGYFYANKSAGLIFVCDAEIVPDKAVVKLTKTDMDGNFVAGAKFTLVSADETVNLNWTSAATDKVKSFELSDGNYTLTETEAAPGYNRIERSVQFSIENGVISVNTDQDAFIESDGGVYTFDSENTLFTSKNTFETYSISINKIDNNKAAVEGAILRVNNSDGSPLVERIETDENGAASVENEFVMNVVYTLVEVDPPVGYLPAESINFKFDENGDLWIQEGRGDFEKQKSNVITMVDEKSSIKISKYEITGQTEISNAKLTIYEADGTTVVKDDEGKDLSWFSVAGSPKELVLPDGSYILAETGDTFDFDGHTYKVTNSTLAFSIVNGKLNIQAQNSLKDELAQEGTKEGYYFYNDTTDTIMLCDAERFTATVTISKKAIGGEAELPGAKLSIYTNENCTERAKDSQGNTINEWTSTGTAKSFTLAEGTYYLKETGDKFTGKIGNKDVEFKVITSVLKFTVDDQGNVTADIDANADKTVNGNGYFDVDASDSNHFIVSDAYTVIPKTATVTISKKAIGGEAELPGAKLSIYTNENCTERAKDSQGNTINEWTSTSTAKSFTLAEGTYYLKETGDKFTGKIGNKDVEFKVITSVLKFTVDDQGNVTADIDANADKTVNGNGYFDVDASDSNHFIVSDAYTVIPKNGSVKISKTEISGQTEIAGAKLSLFTNEGCTEKAKDSNGTVINEWESGTTAREFSLAAGTYYLKETGDEFTVTVNDEKVTYKVVTSVLKFTVDTDGNVSVPAQDGLKAQADADSEDGYFLYDAESNTIKVCDAENVDESGSGGNSGDNPGGNNGDNPGGNNGDNPGGNNGDNPGGNNGDNPGGNNGDNPGGNNSGDENPPRTGATGTKAGFAALLIAAAAVIAGNKKKKS